MIKKLLITLCLLVIIKNFSQSKKLIGEWFLDKIIQSDGKNLEINHPKYSFYLTYNIKPNELKIGNSKFEAKFFTDQIKLENRNLKYWFENEYLLVQEDNEIYLFLKPNDFIKKYPEFQPKNEVRNGESILVANHIIHPNFNYEKNLDDFLLQQMPEESLDVTDDLSFKVEFILTKDNKINHIKIIDKQTPLYDSQFVLALEKAEKYFKNPYGKDFLVLEERNFLKSFKNLKDKKEKNLFMIIKKGQEYYDENEFQKAISELNKLDDIKIPENRFITMFQDGYLLLGISYLAVGNNKDACHYFKKVGDITDFKVRNYLIDFCK